MPKVPKKIKRFLKIGHACLGPDMSCRTGSCRNDKETTGCENDFEYMHCKNYYDWYCYKEQQHPYGPDAGNYIL